MKKASLNRQKQSFCFILFTIKKKLLFFYYVPSLFFFFMCNVCLLLYLFCFIYFIPFKSVSQYRRLNGKFQIKMTRAVALVTVETHTLTRGICVKIEIIEKKIYNKYCHRTWMPNRPLDWLLLVKRVDQDCHHHRCPINAMNDCVPIGCVSLSMPNTVNDPFHTYYPNHRQYWCHHQWTMVAVVMQPPLNFYSYSKNGFGSCGIYCCMFGCFGCWLICLFFSYVCVCVSLCCLLLVFFNG